jgi:hypothetical protein
MKCLKDWVVLWWGIDGGIREGSARAAVACALPDTVDVGKSEFWKLSATAMNALLVGRVPAFYEAHLRAIIQRAIGTRAAPAAASNHNKIKLLLRARHADFGETSREQLLALNPPNHHWSAACLGNKEHAAATQCSAARGVHAGSKTAKYTTTNRYNKYHPLLVLLPQPAKWQKK